MSVPARAMQEAEMRGARVRWHETGTGPAVVVVPGLGLTGRFYDRNDSAFARAGFRFVVPAMPGFAGTAGPRTGHDVAQGARFVVDFIDLLGLGSVHWIGHSIGAQIVVLAAARAPDRARSVTLVGPTGAQRRGRARLTHQAAGIVREAAHASWQVVAAVARDYLRSSPLVYAGTWLRSARDEPLAHAHDVRCPALVVAGAADPVARRQAVERLAATLPDSSVVPLRGGGHALPRGCAEQFNELVIAFLRRAEGSGRHAS